MNLAALADHICVTVRKTDSDSVAACKNYIRRRDEMLWNGYLWRDSLFTYTKSLDPTAAWNILTNPIRPEAGEVLMPRSCDRVLGLRVSDYVLPVQNMERYFQQSLDAFAQTGNPWEFSLLSPVAYLWDDPITLYVKSTAGDDVDLQVRFYDTVENKFTASSVALTGTFQYVGTTNQLEEVTKPSSAGIVWLASSTSTADVFEPMAADATVMEPYQRIKLTPSPTEALTIRALVKKKYSPIATDEESPRLRQAENVLLAFAMGDMLRRQRQFAKAETCFAEGQALLQKLANIEFHQQANRQRLVPSVEPTSLRDWPNFNRFTAKSYW